MAERVAAAVEWLVERGHVDLEIATAACGAFQSAEIPEVEWLGELLGMEREGQLAAFIATVAQQETSRRDQDS